MTASENDSNKVAQEGVASDHAAQSEADARRVDDTEPETAVAAATGTRRPALNRWLAAGLVIAIIVIVALVASLRQQQERLDTFGREAARRLDDIARRADDAQAQAQQAMEQVQAAAARVSGIERLARTTEAQQRALEEAYRELANARQEAILVEVEQSLLLAAEQLQLSGRIPSAIAALQLAEARLVGAGRPAYLSAQQAIARDISRLQALPYTDLSALSAQIDTVIRGLQTFPLLSVDGLVEAASGDGGQDNLSSAGAAATASIPAGEAATTNEAAPAASTWWERVWIPVRDWSARVRRAALAELESLVRVRRVDTPEALLVAPEQADLLRAQLVLRMIEARMALLGRFPDLWDENLAQVIDAVKRYGDTESIATRRLLASLRQLQQVDLSPPLPDLNDSLSAVRSLLAGNGSVDNDANSGSTGGSENPAGASEAADVEQTEPDGSDKADSVEAGSDSAANAAMPETPVPGQSAAPNANGGAADPAGAKDRRGQ